ncbi:hypothetical protein PIB30_035400 [Stylosanthes scabra]|uniref:Uncharacterized protein n=1 Tax=Stylosanthes scabra TaxID=79078 RepID=A0ABU6ZC70_9FABA|nr:hypothetical protein [Stylosanthes scabra]
MMTSDFQILTYQAQKRNAGAMYKVGLFYYFGLRGLHRYHSKALLVLEGRREGRTQVHETSRALVWRGTTRRPLNGLPLHPDSSYILLITGCVICMSSKVMESTRRITPKQKKYSENAADNAEVGGHYNMRHSTSWRRFSILVLDSKRTSPLEEYDTHEPEVTSSVHLAEVAYLGIEWFNSKTRKWWEETRNRDA